MSTSTLIKGRQRKGTMSGTETGNPGMIDPQAIYRLDEFLSRMGWSKYAWRSAKSKGLRPVIFGGRRYIRGVDAAALLDRVAEEQA